MQLNPLRPKLATLSYPHVHWVDHGKLDPFASRQFKSCQVDGVGVGDIIPKVSGPSLNLARNVDENANYVAEQTVAT